MTLEYDISVAEKEVEETKKELDEYFESHDKTALENKQKEIEVSLKDYSSRIETVNQEVVNLRISNSENNRKKPERITELRSNMADQREKLMNEINEIDTFIGSVDLKISELNNKKSEIIQNARNIIDTEKLKLESQLSQVKTIPGQFTIFLMKQLVYDNKAIQQMFIFPMSCKIP